MSRRGCDLRDQQRAARHHIGKRGGIAFAEGSGDILAAPIHLFVISHIETEARSHRHRKIKEMLRLKRNSSVQRNAAAVTFASGDDRIAASQPHLLALPGAVRRQSFVIYVFEEDQMLRQEISFEVHGFSPFLYREAYSVAPPFGCGTGTGGG